MDAAKIQTAICLVADAAGREVGEWRSVMASQGAVAFVSATSVVGMERATLAPNAGRPLQVQYPL